MSLGASGSIRDALSSNLMRISPRRIRKSHALRQVTKSSLTRTPRSVRIQQTTLDGIGRISLIRHRNEAFFDALES
jgi:hypothetical protein